MRDGPRAGLALIDELIKHDDLAHYQWTHSAQADLYRRLGQSDQARAAYQKALNLSQKEPERRFLERRLQEREKNDWAAVENEGYETTRGAAQLKQKEKVP